MESILSNEIKKTNKIDKILEYFAPLYDGLFYFPGDKDNFLPEGADTSNVTKFDIQNSIEDKINIWHLKAKNPIGIIIHCHGSGYNISSHFPHVSWLPLFNYDVFMFDYPGYGESSGSSNRQSTVQTAYDVIKYVTEANKSKLPIFVLGQSLGGNIASVALSKHPYLTGINGVILDSMYSSFQVLAALKIHRKYIKFSKSLSNILALFVSEKDAPLKCAKNLNLPILLIHSRNDGIVPYQESINFYNALDTEDAEFWSHLNSGHTDVLQNNIDGYREALVDWMKSKSLK